MKTQTTFKVLAILIAIVVLLFGGISLTGAAAQAAIPGDALYPVKTTIENTRLSLAQDAGNRAQMKLAFAEQRLEEISALIREGRYNEIREAVLAFEASINEAILELEAVSAADPARAALITQEVTSALTRYAQVLSELAATEPDSVRPEVNRALDTTQIVTGLGTSSGNENVNANDNSNDNGDDIVDDNTNTNDNDNGDDNGNGGFDDNSNDNADDNVNSSDDNGGDDNSNSNDNADDHGNDNGLTGNDNGNDNGDDNSNDSSGSGDNTNDDNSGSGNSGSGGGDDSDGDSNDDNSGKGKGGNN